MKRGEKQILINVHRQYFLCLSGRIHSNIKGENMIATKGKLMFQTVLEAFHVAGIEYNDDDPSGILVWNDSVKEADYFSALKPYQIVNRIPQINMICRKAPFVRLIQRIQPVFPNLFTFLPNSFVLPFENARFTQITAKHDKRYIIKPDGGSLGLGIMILEPNMTYFPSTHLAIAQEYVESKTIDHTKFDLRIYALIACINPLRVYVYREGVARFCSSPVEKDDIYSKLTNTAVNRGNCSNVSSITKTLSFVFEKLEEEGINTKDIWKKIDNAIILTIIAAHNYVLKTAHEVCPSYGLPRCFQILGFDVLLDEKLDPYILEVNYRPSLEFDTEEEKQLKIEMLSSAMKIAAPFKCLQPIVSGRTITWNDKNWTSFIEHNPDIVKKTKADRTAAVHASKFVRIFPTKTAQNAEYERVLNAVKSIPATISDNLHRIPEAMEMPALRRLQKTCVRPIITKPKRRQSPQRKKPAPLYQ